MNKEQEKERQTDCRKILDKAVTISKTYRQNPLEQGNLFTILDMENKEVSAHSAFLYFVFKPFQKEDDEYDDFNLRCLLDILLKAKGECKSINEYKCVDIRREVSFEFGRMDFVITADEETFVVELKVWAREQREQIPRYQKYLIEQGSDKDNIFFLTPIGRESKTSESVINITLKNEIKRVLSTICAKRSKYNEYAAMIKQYISIIDKLTQGNGYMKDTIDVINNAEEIKAVDYLIENRNRCLQTIMIQFFSQLKEVLGDTLSSDGIPNAKLVKVYPSGDEGINKYYSKNNLYPALAYEIEDCSLKSDCKLKSDVNLYFFIELDDRLYCGITPRTVETQDNDLKWNHCDAAIENYQKLLDNLKAVQKKHHTKTFAIWEYLTIDKSNINFSIEALNGHESFLRLLTKDSLSIDNNIINELAKQIKNKYKQHCELIFDKAL